MPLEEVIYNSNTFCLWAIFWKKNKRILYPHKDPMITIYSKDYCPYCSAAKELISSLWFTYKEVDVSDDIETYKKIKNVSWLLTVPQIFTGDISKENCLWGYSDIKKLHEEGHLLERLKK